MTDKEITYTTVRFHRSSELQNRGRPDEAQRSRVAGHRKSSASWHFFVIPLGILCSILLVTVAVLVMLIFQDKYELMKCQNNLDQSTAQNTSFFNKTLTNTSSDYKDCKNQEELNRCCGKTKAVLDYRKYTGKCNEAHLFCCGIKCYYFIMDNKHWNDCKLTCQDCSLSLLKIDEDDELKFLKYHLTRDTFWIGLSYEINKSKWRWIDNRPSNLDLMKLKLLKENGGCACLSFRGIHEGDCATKHPCICEKRMDILPDSECNKKGKNQKTKPATNQTDKQISKSSKDEQVAHSSSLVDDVQELGSQHTISSFHFGREEGQNNTGWSILQKELSSVFHLELLREIRTGKNNLFFILSFLQLHHHLDEMKNQQVIYSNSRVFESSSESQSPASQDETQGPREVGHKVALVILCLLLMMAIVVWLTYIFQCSQEKYDQSNLYQTIRQNINSFNKTLTNESPEHEDCKHEKEQNRCCEKTKAILDYGKYTGKCAEAHVLCCGIKCYYFIMDNKHWNDCKLTCQDCSLSLLKIEDGDELKFLKYQITADTFWIGLSYEISKSKWQWIDNGPSNLDLMKLKLLKENGYCAWLSFRGIHEGDCGTKHPCICEKRMNRFPDSVCSMKGK
uniref:uncharacterized protein LOC125399297 n=1 Tax=Myodes glareolus TaxID=447135 RepID=UPI00202026B4|nr:uncharacterized protein LOC125399297 [Myodes glareolus]